MRRKKITVSVNELPEEIKTGVIEYIEKKMAIWITVR